MGYRIDREPIKPEDMLRRFDVRNGAIMRCAFGCYYFIPKPGHDPHYHDHKGYPTPHYHHSSCQMKPPRDRLPWFPWPVMRTDEDLEHINLKAEGYTTAKVVFDTVENVEHLTANAWIDEYTDNVVRMTVNAQLPEFVDKPQDFKFTVFVSDEDEHGEYTVKDAVCHGIVTVLPGAPY